MREIRVIGAGPAGSSAAIAALAEGCAVTLFEKSRFPRHKVCGEFLSPEAAPVLESLGIWSAFEQLSPARVRRAAIHAGRQSSASVLSDCAYGISRRTLDAFLFDTAVARGATSRQEKAAPEGSAPAVLACGRLPAPSAAPQADRLFGFKAHFSGPVDDAVELFFFERCYIGVNCIEDSLTNVCGIAPESVLRRYGFQMDAVAALSPALAARLTPLTRTMEWIATGPLAFSRAPSRDSAEQVYPAGDALGFTDPFTGTGILNALSTGRLAGIAAARALPKQAYIADCANALARPYRVNSALRRIALSGWAERVAALVPAGLLFRVTRPGW